MNLPNVSGKSVFDPIEDILFAYWVEGFCFQVKWGQDVSL